GIDPRSRPCAAEGRRDRRQRRRQEIGRRAHRRPLRDGRELTVASLPAPISPKWNQCDRQTRSAPSPACGGGVGEGVSANDLSYGSPPPCPSPASGGGNDVAPPIEVRPAMVRQWKAH